MTSPNIILTGFMGTGKTVVGKAVAEHLGRFFVDMDEIIEQRAGKPISAVFAEDGELAFRMMEAELCRELAHEQGIVIATGGGALVNQGNRDALARSGVLFCLNARPEEIILRLQHAGDRPLLATPERRQRVVELLAQRAAAYGAIPNQVDTSGLSVEEVAERVIRLYRQQGPGPARIPVALPGSSYDILVADGLLMEAGHALAEAGLRTRKVGLISQPAIVAAHGERLAASLAEAGFPATVLEIPDGEAHKNLATVARLYERLVVTGMDRHSPLIALGGGVVGDVAGFVAATYLRGVPFVQIPSTLLAMVDASVGGKTGVDLPQGKNLVGAFKQPELVIIDPELLSTLPALEFRSGLAEVVKHGMIGDPVLFARLEGRPSIPADLNGQGSETGGPLDGSGLASLITAAVRVKVAVVVEDPFELGRRAVLNLGHTFAHALEVLSDYQMRHGEAVSIGLAAATRLSARLGICDNALVTRVEGLLSRLDLPLRYEGPPPDQVVAAMATDKKRKGSLLRFVLPRAIGEVDVFDQVPLEAVAATLEEMRV